MSLEKNILMRTIFSAGTDLWRGRMPLLERICLEALESKTFSIPDSNFHL
jgi:hypothetical protein